MSRSDEFFLSARQSETLTRFAHITRRDVFYDLGCGDGQVVCTAITKGHASKAIGVELDKNNYRHAWLKAISYLPKSQLKRVNFWLGRLDSDETDEGTYIFDYSDATVPYNSLQENEDDINFFRSRFPKKGFRIITKDLPLVGYQGLRNTENNDCWFFMHRFPLKRVPSLSRWTKSAMGKEIGVQELYGYYANQLERRGIRKREIDSAVGYLKYLVSLRF